MVQRESHADQRDRLLAVVKAIEGRDTPDIADRVSRELKAPVSNSILLLQPYSAKLDPIERRWVYV